VKSIDGTKITVQRRDGETQTIEADENTSFEKGREKVTLADIKPGDQVTGRGALKDGVFVPTELRVGGFGEGPRAEGQNSGAPGVPAGEKQNPRGVPPSQSQAQPQ
jgi:Domain of unknown function (DUF5666)